MPSLPLAPDCGRDHRKAGTCAIEVKMAQGDVLTKETCQSSQKKGGIGWEVDPPKAHESLGS